MKRSLLGWLVFALAAIVLAGYVLNRGLYVGSVIDVSAREGPGNLLYSKGCRYLHFDGVHGTIGVETRSRDQAEQASCALLGSSD